MEAAIKAIYGPQQSGDAWILEVHFVDGSKKKRPYPSEQGAKAAKTRMMKTARVGKAEASELRRKDLPDYDETLKWWIQVMAKIATVVAGGGDNDARNDLKALASAALAVKQLYDLSEAEDRLREIEKRQAEMAKAKKHGVGILGSSEAGRSGLGSN